jgi:hypothetical protein
MAQEARDFATQAAKQAEQFADQIYKHLPGEEERVVAEEQRLTNEETRVANEAERVSSELSRDATFKGWAQDIASLPSFDSRISANSDRLTNIEAGLPSSVWRVDDTAARVKDVPENARPKAIVSKIGGMTYRDDTTNTLRSAKVTGVKSVGANLIPSLSERTAHGVTIKKDTDGVYYLSGTATNNVDEIIQVGLPKGRYSLKLNCSKAIGTATGDSIYIACRTSKMSWVLTIGAHQGDVFINAEVSEIKDILFVISAGVNCDGVTIAPMLNKGSTAKPYTPYVEHTLPIPEAVQALDGYGLGVNEDYYNYITWKPDDNIKTWNKRVGVVDLGTLNWLYITDKYGNHFQAEFSGGKTEGKVLCAKYKGTTAWTINNTNIDKAVGIEAKYISIRDTSYTDTVTFKSTLSGVMLVYELAEPEVTDISDLLSDDNFIEVEGNGLVKLENEYKYGAPSSITFQFKEDSL